MADDRASEALPSSSDIDYPRIGIISFGHFTNDMCGNLMTSLTPYLVVRGEITVTVAGLFLLVYLIGSSVLQPAFGLLSDRTGRRYFAVLGPLWVGAAASLFGWAGNAATLLALGAMGGIGSAAFHPQAASMIDRLSRRSKGWAMSLFSMGGNVGFALGPVVAAGVAAVGLHWSVLVLIPGLALTALMALFAPDPSAPLRPEGGDSIRSLGARQWRPLSLIVGVIALRSGVQFALIIFLPLYFHARGLPTQLGSYAAFGLSIAGAMGGLLGGRLSDVWGRKLIVVGSLLVTVPLLVVALIVPPSIALPFWALTGATLLASNSVTVVQGQELLPGSTGIASGLTLGLAFGLSGVITVGLTSLSGHAGVTAAVFVLPFITLVTAAIAWFVPERRVSESRVERTSVPPLGMTGAS